MKAFFVAALLFFLPSAYAAERAIVISVKPAETSFDIRLPSNPTTGYKWTMTQYDKTLISLTSEQYIAPQSKAIGAGGYEVFSFKLIENVPRPTSTTVILTYKRPWEKTGLPPQTVIVNFQKLP